MAALEFIRTYQAKASLDDHLEKLIMVFIRLQEAQLKVNAQKSKLCALENKYLGYTQCKGGMKLQMNKVQAMLALKPPMNVNKLQKFLGMVQYYRDMWSCCSHSLT